MATESLLQKLDDLEARFHEVSLLITDPAVIADMKRFVKLNREYRDLEPVVAARKEYIRLQENISSLLWFVFRKRRFFRTVTDLIYANVS